MLKEGIDLVEGVVARAYPQPGSGLDHVQGGQPDVDAEVVGAVFAAGQQAHHPHPQGFHLGHQHHQQGRSAQQQQQGGQLAPEGWPGAGAADGQQEDDHPGLGHQSHPGAAAVGEHQGCQAQHQGRQGKQLAGQPGPAQQTHQGQRQHGQEVTRQQVGVFQGAVDPHRAIRHRIGVGPAGQFAGVRIELADADHAGDQFAGQQGRHDPVPPDRRSAEQLAHQGVDPQVADQFHQPLGGSQGHRREPRGQQGQGEYCQDPAVDLPQGSWGCAQGNQQPQQATGKHQQAQAAAGHQGQASHQGAEHEPGHQGQPPAEGTAGCVLQRALPAQQEGNGGGAQGAKAGVRPDYQPLWADPPALRGGPGDCCCAGRARDTPANPGP